jgi:hypothetical protein
MPSQVALVAGLGMLIALERRDVRGDVAACVLLLVALASHPLGVAFAAAAIVSVALRPAGERWRRWWVVVPPIALFALWWVTLHGSFPHSSYPSFGDAVSFIADSFVAVCAAASGFFRAPWDGGADFINGFSVALALVAAAAAAAMLAARRPVPATAWTALAAFAVALIAPALAPAGYLSVFRQPDAPRYLYPNALLLFLVVAELGALLRPRTRELRNALIAGGAFIFIVSLVSNVGLLVGRAHEYTRDASALRSKLAGAELAGVRSVPIAPADLDKEAAGFQLTLFLSVPRPLPPAALAAYYTVSHSFGTPAYTAEQVMGLPKDLQREAALQFRSALRLNRGSAG